MRLALPPLSVSLVLLLVVLPAAVYDLRFRRIPNWISVGGVAAGLAVNAIVGTPRGGLRLALGGLALGFGFYFVLYAVHAMGAGDVKLMGAVGSLVGAQNWVGILVLTALLGGAAALWLAITRRRLGATAWNLTYIVGQLIRFRPAYLGREELDVKSSKALGLPHGAVIAAASIAFLGLSAWYGR